MSYFCYIADEIQCLGAELVQAIREDSLKLNPRQGGDYYALHVRRGDFQFKEVKISAQEIVRNLDFNGPDGLPLIPKGSLVYLSTDDPEVRLKIYIFIDILCSFLYAITYITQ